MKAKDLDDRAVLSLVHHANEAIGTDRFFGVGHELVRLGVPEKLAYHKLDKQPGLMFGTSLMTCWWDHPKEKDGAWQKLQKLGGPLPLEESEQLIRDAVNENL